MGIRTGQQFLDKINSMRPHLTIDGEVVTEKVTEHPAFAGVARTYAKLYDLQHDPAHAAALTYPSPSTGDPVSASFLIPQTQEDLEHGRDGATWAEFSHGFLGRTADYLNGALTALAAASDWFTKADPEYGDEDPRLLRVRPRK